MPRPQRVCYLVYDYAAGKVYDNNSSSVQEPM